MRRSTFVTVHARATPETEGLISRQMIDLMPAGGVLVNCARGSLVDYDAVGDALDAGKLFGAAFDVFPPRADPRRLTPADDPQHRHDATPGRRRQTDRLHRGLGGSRIPGRPTTRALRESAGPVPPSLNSRRRGHPECGCDAAYRAGPHR
ncbi:NAD(P)-dependent oxidoreductase [Streptomyces sp. GLT-R25]